MHAIETWKHRDPSRRRDVAQFADTLHPLWLLNRSYLFEEEARAAVLESCGTMIDVAWSPDKRLGWAHSGREDAPGGGGGTYRICPFRTSPLEIFPQARGAGPKTNDSRAFGLAALVETFDEAPEIPSSLLQIHQAYADAQPSAGSATPSLQGAETFVAHVFARAWRDLSPSGREAVQQLATSIDLRRCPALYTYLQIRPAIHRDAAAKPAPSEMVDIVHVIALPYVDAFSTDKRIVDYLRRSKVGPRDFRGDRVRRMKPFRLLALALEWLEHTASASTTRGSN
jgi:hypothetical protein